ncbi:MAG: cytochrome b/b6 domain-containing protein [Planctomycetota bacterium]|jgi:cytochrome b subunit of formate dehydrogenase
MFRVTSIIGFAVVFAGIIIHCLARPCGKKRRWCPIDILRKLVHLFTLLFLEQKLSPAGVLRKLVYLLTLFCFVVLLVTGFYHPLVLGKHLSGYLLMLHATFAPVFAACIAVLAVMWAHNCRFDKNYWPWLQRILRRQGVNDAAVEKYELGRKICFWLIIVLALPVILSIILSMLGPFGTCMQEFLLEVHRYSTLALALAAIIHTYLTIRSQMEE